MKDRKSKCSCAKSGVMCALKLSLIKQGVSASDSAIKNKAICPLKAAVLSNAS
ncbi:MULTISPECIES: hypothetical protein [Flavobacterium]|uniref:Uncharacterized protein n=1 Tax=Flavobacterium lipolyticum TaxID=2893754 RepID=A0ABS8M230_9FLAO|nr:MULTISPECIES: hypothetical protein [unclassified Flavobacterium]MCC9018882.1 hypothetical protein [Flavobacterium sp. F-126]